jgi:Zn-finger nucleic acid-binding protein
MEAYGRSSDHAEFVVADMCLECGGVWLDGGEVGKVYPALQRLETMAPEPDPQAGLVQCPRCQAQTTAFRFFDVIIDHCAACRGLWVDGPELANLARHRDREDGLTTARAVESYRSSASRALRQALVVCTRCKVDVPLQQVVSTHEGPHCEACAKALELEMQDADLADYKVPKRWF